MQASLSTLEALSCSRQISSRVPSPLANIRICAEMDESPFPSGSQDIYSRQSHAARDMSNLMDQSLDLRAGSGTAVEDEDDFGSQQGSSARSTAGPHDVLNKGKGRATGAVDEEDIAGRAAALNLEDGQARDNAQDYGAQAQQQEHDNELPTEPPLSAQQRRERALTEERDQLALLNTSLERALHSLEAALPRVEVGYMLLQVALSGLHW